jgi:hypothetical protein
MRSDMKQHQQLFTPVSTFQESVALSIYSGDTECQYFGQTASNVDSESFIRFEPEADRCGLRVLRLQCEHTQIVFVGFPGQSKLLRIEIGQREMRSRLIGVV